MKTLRLLALLLLLPGFGDPVVLPDVSLDGLWFKTVAKCKGRAVESDGSDIHKAVFSTPAYLHLVLAESAGAGDGIAPSTLYTCFLYTESSPDTWTSSAPVDVSVVVTSKDQYIIPDLVAAPQSVDGVVPIRVTLLVKVKRDKEGAVTGAKLTTLGGQSKDGQFGLTFLFGGCTLNGKAIDAADLPFPF